MRNFDFKAKSRALGWHLLLSFVVSLALAAWMYFCLFPSFYFGMSGGWQGLGLVFGIDLVLGPLLTFLVFNPKKPRREKIGDFAVIGTVQLAALVYGMYMVYQAHPKMLLFYPNSYSAVVPYQEWAGNDALNTIDTAQMVRLDGVPVAVQSRAADGSASFVSLAQAGNQVAEADASSRRNIKGEDRLLLNQLEVQHGKVYVFSVVGKYRRAFIAVDKDFRVVGKFGEAAVNI